MWQKVRSLTFISYWRGEGRGKRIAVTPLNLLNLNLNFLNPKPGARGED
jgi:hypothetical protein